MPANPPASPADLPGRVRLFPLAGSVLLPRAVMPLNIFEPRYLAMVRDAMADDQMIAIVQPRETAGSDTPPLYPIGGLGRITQFAETGDGRLLIALTGLIRLRITSELPVLTAYRQAEVSYADFLTDWGAADPLAAAARADLEGTLKTYLEAQGLSADWDAVKSADDESLVSTLSLVCPFVPAERQALLEAADLPKRADLLSALMRFTQGHGSERTLQ